MKRSFFALLLCLPGTFPFAQNNSGTTRQTAIPADAPVKPRMRVIIDNDFSGDPDGLFQLVHHLLSPSVEIRAVIGSHLKPGDGFDRSDTTATNARKKAAEIVSVMNIGKDIPVYQGSNIALLNDSTPHRSEAAMAIVKEAMRTDVKTPLYVVCGAGLTEIASAWLIEPRIAERMTLIWIGGPEYSDMAPPPPGYTSLEYNLGIDIKAGQAIFNRSAIPLWQVPRNAYREALFPYSSLLLKVKTRGKIGQHLAAELERIMQASQRFKFNVGETYVLGDSPLVLLTALQSSFEADPSSSRYLLRPCPFINNQGLYETNLRGRNIRVYTGLDIPLMFEDFVSKLELFHINNPGSN